jgi:hypothetical protein
MTNGDSFDVRVLRWAGFVVTGFVWAVFLGGL